MKSKCWNTEVHFRIEIEIDAEIYLQSVCQTSERGKSCALKKTEKKQEKNNAWWIGHEDVCCERFPTTTCVNANLGNYV